MPWNPKNFDNKEQSHEIFSDVTPDRTSVDNILRLNYTNQLRLTLMADTKANIMITVTSIVFSVALNNFDNKFLQYPLMSIGLCSIISLVCAIIVIMPKIDYPKDEHGHIDKNSPFYNPLFFGHFAHIPVLEFKAEYAKRLMTDAKIMDALTGDIYGIGRVIATNKFKYLRYSYVSFLTGLSGSVVIFMVQLFFT